MAADRRTGILRQLLRTWGAHAALELMWMTRDWRYFLTNNLSHWMTRIAGISGVLLLAERFAGIGVWSKFQLIFMLGYALLVEGLVGTFFDYNVLEISRRLGRGQLDHTLIQPRPIWMALLTEGFMPLSNSPILITGLGLVVWASVRLELEVTAGWIGMIVLNLGSSCAVVLAYSYLLGSLAFWEPRMAEEISARGRDLLYTFKAFPLDAVGPALSAVLMTAIPAGLVAWYPSKYLLGLNKGFAEGVVTLLAAVALMVFASLIFNRGMKYYVTTGSQRYSPFGHRR